MGASTSKSFIVGIEFKATIEELGDLCTLPQIQAPWLWSQLL